MHNIISTINLIPFLLQDRKVESIVNSHANSTTLNKSSSTTIAQSRGQQMSTSMGVIEVEVKL